jgi:hypothetical protein
MWTPAHQTSHSKIMGCVLDFIHLSAMGVAEITKTTHSKAVYTRPFSLGSLRNVLVFERKAHFLSIKRASN